MRLVSITNRVKDQQWMSMRKSTIILQALLEAFHNIKRKWYITKKLSDIYIEHPNFKHKDAIILMEPIKQRFVCTQNVAKKFSPVEKNSNECATYSMKKMSLR